MKRTALILIGLWSVAALHAQERPTPLFKADSVALTQLTVPPQMKFSTIWLKEATNPILRQRRAIYEKIEQRSRESIVSIPRPRTQDLNKNAGLWRITAGNTSSENWSPFPDRALDARIIRFPLPRNMSPDKRPLNVQQLEKLNKLKQ